MGLSADLSVCEPFLQVCEMQDGVCHQAISGEGVKVLAEARSLSVLECMVLLLRRGIWPVRFLRNAGFLSSSDQALLLQKKAVVVGCGGLGGYAASLAARVGFGSILLCDGDEFQESNLNRQLFCTEQSIGLNKADVTGAQITLTASYANITTWATFATDENLPAILLGADVVFDCLDSISARIMVEKAAHAANAIFIHGALSGVEGMVGVSRKENPLVATLYGMGNKTSSGFDSAPSMTPPLVASVQVYLAVCAVTGQMPPDNAFWHLDFSQPVWDIFSL